jgi:putative membrane protein
MNPETPSDPRVYFAAERTLLAWLRTGIAVIGLGFLVARFGVFLMIVRGAMIERSQIASSLIGIGFVVLGAFMIAAATWQHLQFSRMLSENEKPEHYSMTLSLWVSVLVAISGLILAVYLAFSIARVQPHEGQNTTSEITAGSASQGE